MNKKKIIVITYLLPSKLNLGRGIFVEKQWSYIKNKKLRDNENIQFITWHETKECVYRDNDNVSCIHYNLKNKNKLISKITRLIYGIKLFTLIFLKLVYYSWDIVVLEWVDTYIMFITNLVNKLKRKTVIGYFRGSDMRFQPFKSRLSFSFFKININSLSALHCVSKELKKIATKIFDVNESKVYSNTGGFSLIGHSNVNQIPKELVIAKSKYQYSALMIGGFDNSKLQTLAVKTFKYLSPNYGLFFIGDGENLQKTIDLSKKMNLTNIHFLGIKEHIFIINYIDNVDLCIHFSKSEGAPIAIMEEMSRGKVIFANRIGGIPELLEENRGILINKNNPLEISNIIKSTMENKELIKQIEINAKMYANRNLTLEVHSNRLLKIISDTYNKKIN